MKKDSSSALYVEDNYEKRNGVEGALEVPVLVKREVKLKYFDLRDLFPDFDDLLDAVNIMDDLRRGVILFDDKGNHLENFTDVYSAFMRGEELSLVENKENPEKSH